MVNRTLWKSNLLAALRRVGSPSVTDYHWTLAYCPQVAVPIQSKRLAASGVCCQIDHSVRRGSLSLFSFPGRF